MSGYPCTVCGHVTRVIDSRPSALDRIRRRRECCACNARFTTFEVRAEDLSDENVRKVDALCSDVDAAVERYRNGASA